MDQPTPSLPNAYSDLFRREYNIGDLLSAAWNVYVKNAATIIIVTIIIYIPINILSTLLAKNAASLAESDAPFLGGILSANLGLLLLLTSLAGVLVPLAIAFVVRTTIDGGTATYQEALRQAISRWLPGIGTSMLMGVFLVGLVILLVVPAIIFGIFWSFAIYAVMLNNKSGMDALRHSKDVVSGRWWRVFGVLIVFGLISGAADWVVGLPLAFATSSFIGSVLTATVSSIIFSFFTVASVVFFLNLESNRPPTLSVPDQSKGK